MILHNYYHSVAALRIRNDISTYGLSVDCH